MVIEDRLIKKYITCQRGRNTAQRREVYLRFNVKMESVGHRTAELQMFEYVEEKLSFV